MAPVKAIRLSDMLQYGTARQGRLVSVSVERVVGPTRAVCWSAHCLMNK